MDTKSVFVLVDCWKKNTREAELYQAEIKQRSKHEGKLIVSPVRSFGDHGSFGDRGKGRHSWIFPSPLCLLTSQWFNGKLYMLVPEMKTTSTANKWSSKGRTFDPRHKLMGSFKAPDSLGPWGALISAYGNLYYLAMPSIHLDEHLSPFQRYHPSSGSGSDSWQSDTWEPLPRIPHDVLSNSLHDYITGYAVYGGHILVSCYNSFIAYHLHDKKWHYVSYDYSVFIGFRGRAVVAGDYIYATDSMCGVYEFSFDCTAYTLSTPLFLRGLDGWHPEEMSYANIVHLGNNKFCLVQCGDMNDCQSLFITTFIIVGEAGSKSIKTLESTIYDVDYTRESRIEFETNFAFTPDCPYSESEGEDPMQVQMHTGGRLSTDGHKETERDTNGLEESISDSRGGKGKGHSRGGRGNGHLRGGRGKGRS